MAKMTLAITTTLEPRGPAAAVILTDDQVEAFGAGRTFPVRVTIGELSQPARLARMGDENLIGLSKVQREALGVQVGDEVDVRIELDEAPREVEVPEVLSEALAAAGLRQAFDALAPSRRKEHARSVAEAKQDDTRERRVQKVLDALRGS
ncbi:YdeI/OmpD-associated family protein [Aeromicrobium duanguangcaii]|uniref:YdeI/OmpD-associated family protein n=1 Tax=Aeromicrobium duanguangcaii TaxID=2968086 RepID=UPI002017E045|nr:YdeI/OmpD-associated family protein [Aeromicrobium duanguangcaii]MCL3836328.1 YdeI/OmpD-associated family protein [Aeromicrobium duanguangcaii]